MKKLTALLIVAAVVFALSASAIGDDLFSDSAYAKALVSTAPQSPVFNGMGGAGLALLDSTDALFLNPAGMGRGRWYVAIPSVGVTLYHPYDLLQEDATGTPMYERIMNEVENEDYGAAAVDILSIVGSGNSKLLGADLTAALKMGNFGLGVNLNETIHTYNGNIITETNVTAPIGVGFGLNFGPFRVDAGAVVKPTGKIISQKIGAADFITSDDMEETIMTTPLAVIAGLPVDAGVAVSLGDLTATVTVEGINGKYQYLVTTAKEASENPEAIENTEPMKFEVRPSINAGVAFHTVGLVSTAFALDIRDVEKFQETMDNGAEFKDALIRHMNAGAELGLLGIASVRAGLNQGYWTAGATFNLYFARVDAAYYWHEIGSTAGEKGLDAFSIRFTLGFDD